WGAAEADASAAPFPLPRRFASLWRLSLPSLSILLCMSVFLYINIINYKFVILATNGIIGARRESPPEFP
ncbi:MAG: hypothetical protein IIV27_05225, partial [Clostridia bacterium]|nr:hypothetical protein [Clostridia bacterium]